MRLHAATTRKYLLFISLSLICLHNPNSASYSNAQWKVFWHASILSWFFFFLGMNQFGQMGGMQSMGQRSTPPLAPLNQVGITVAFSIIPLGSYEYHLLTDLLWKSSKCSRRGYMRRYMTCCFISRWVWEQRGWVSLTPHRYRTSTSLQASFLGPVQDLVQVLVPLVWISQEHRMLCMR